MREFSNHLVLIVRLLAAFAFLGVFLAVLGIYGVMDQVVLQRKSEYGIRLALGARFRDIRRQVLLAGVKLASMGTVLGVVCAVALGRLLSSLSPEFVSPAGPIVAVIAVGITIASLLATWLPARHAAGSNPLDSLRAE